MEKRPWRADFFERFAAIVGGRPGADVLELGSGPGYLAEHVMRAVPGVNYTLLDFSDAMHDLARSRLRGAATPPRHVTADFRETNWINGLGPFDFVLTMQAVHELRHKARAVGLHSQVRGMLQTGGAYLVCDHYAGDDGMADRQLYMTIAEQRAALEAAGFRVHEVLKHRGLVLHHAA